MDVGGVGVVDALKDQLAEDGGRGGGVLERAGHGSGGGISCAVHWDDEPEPARDEEAGSRSGEKAESKTDASSTQDDSRSVGVVDMAVEREDREAEEEEDEAGLESEEDAGGG